MEMAGHILRNVLYLVVWIVLGFGLAMVGLHGITGAWRRKGEHETER